jgi:hypothetical protein
MIDSWGLSRATKIEVLNRLAIDLPSDPDRFLKEQVVPYADRFTYPFTLKADKPLSFVFVIRRDDAKRELEVVGAIFVSAIADDDGDGNGQL